MLLLILPALTSCSEPPASAPTSGTSHTTSQAAESDWEAFLNGLGTAVVQRDFSGAHGMLTEWLQESVTADELRNQIGKKLGEISEAVGLEETGYPKRYEIGEGDITVEELREEFEEMPQEVTDENFRQWVVLNFLPGEDEDAGVDAWLGWWLLLVDCDGELKVGFYQIEDPD
jgi:hypothetical protein